jgi:hypothetical protein
MGRSTRHLSTIRQLDDVRGHATNFRPSANLCDFIDAAFDDDG